MEFTKEQIRKAENVNSVDELMAIAKEEGVELSKEQAEKYFDRLNAEGKISDDDLDQIVGGKGEPTPKFKENDKVTSYINLPGGVNVCTIRKVLKYDRSYESWVYEAVTNSSAGNVVWVWEYQLKAGW